jgi:hypothetical protein
MRKFYAKILFLVFSAASSIAVAQYCTPTFTTGCTSGDQIVNFSTTGGITNITNNASGCSTGAYSYISSQSVTQIQGLDVTLSMQAGPTWGQGFKVWIDWNNNQSFADAGELVYTSPGSGVAVNNATVTVPFSAAVGTKRMRVLCNYAGVPATTNGCPVNQTFGECEDYDFVVVGSTACSGTPVAGTAQSTSTAVCPSVSYTLSLLGATQAAGLTYQWQSAPSATGPWTNMPTATTPSFITSQLVDTWYQCIVTCSGASATSSIIAVSTNSFLDCYCTSTATSATNTDILNVTVSTLNNTSTCGVVAPGPASVPGQYSNFTTTVAPPILASGVFYPFTVQVGTCGSNVNNWTKAWIDFNQNGLFTDPGEEIYSSPTFTLGPNTQSGVISIPLTATQGITRMRIVTNQTTVGTAVNPCGTYFAGETEDYFVQIAPPPTCPQPLAPTLVSATLNSATINWSPGGSETQWQIQYGTQGFALGSGTTLNVNAYPHTISSLTPYSFYQAYVRAICGPGDTSFWTPSVSWNTYDQGQYITWDNTCPTGGFIDISTTGTNANLTDDSELGITLPFPVLYQGILFTNMTIGNNGGVILGSTTAQVGYTMVAGTGLYPFVQDLGTSIAPNGVFYQQVGTSPNSKFVIQWENIGHYAFPVLPDGATFELIIDEATQEIYYVYDDVIMGNPTTWDYGADAEIGVRGPQNINVSMNSQTYLQNNSCVHFYYVDCPNPVALTTSYVFPNEAAFTWTASAAGETSWTVVYGPAGFDPATSGTTLTVTSASIQLLNLIPLANYDMYIYASCSGGLQSNGLFYNFQTPPICSNPTAFTSAAGQDSLMSSWNWAPYTSFYPSTGFNLQVVAQDSALYTGSVYALDNNFTDTTFNAAWYPGQAVDVYVQAVCGQDTSAYVGPISLIMPISNDNPCGAFPIVVGAPGLTYNNTGATVSAEELQIVPPVTGAQTTTGWANDALNHTTWFKFVAPASGNVRIDATGVEYNGQIGVYYGTDCSIVPSFTLEGANENEIDGTSEAPNFTVCGLTPGVEYYVLHDGSGTAGSYTIAISEVSVYAGVEGEVLNICYGETANLFLGIANYTLGGEWVATSPAVVLQGSDFNSTDYASQTYTFNYIVSDGCATDQATTTVTVHAMPSAGQDGSITVCLNEPIDLLLGLGGNVDFGGTWYNPSNQAMSNNLDTSGNIGGQFNYDYVVTNPFCPNDTSNVIVVVDASCDYTASIDELANAWNVYPNPTNAILNIETQDLEGKIYLTDINGKVVIEQTDINQHMQMNLTDLSTGMYYLVINQNGVLSTKRVIKN